MAPRQQSQIDLSLSTETKTSMETYLKQLGKAGKDMQQLVNLAKKLGDVSKALEAKAALKNIDGFQSGVQARANRRAASTILDGTAQGRVLGDEREAARQADSMVRSSKELLRNQEAMSVSVRKTTAETKNLTNLTQLQGQLKLAERRLGLELAAGDARRIGHARTLVQTTQERIAFLQREQQILKETKRLEAINRPKPTSAEVAATSRRNTNERLFGDGGANLLRIQAGLAANYMLLSGVRTVVSESLTFTNELDASLRNLQAIVVVSDQGMVKLRDTFISVAESTKFSAVEISNAAVVMGQAGLSVDQIEEAIQATAMLATASGTDLAAAVTLTTSVLGVFNLEAGQTAHVADALTEAVNTSKLDIEKLALALQYSGNTAAEVGVGFEELTAALGAMSNVGIRSGSTLGTGMRQVLISLQKPSKEFLSTLDRVGLTMADVDVRTHGLYGVMTNLADAGFTASDAMKSFEVRGAAAYTALAKNLDQMLQMESSLYDTTAASKANETQMRSLTNQTARFKNSLNAVVSSGLEPLVYLARDVAQGLGDMLGMVDKNSIALKVMVVGATSVIAVGLGAWAIKATLGLGAMLLGTTGLSGGLRALSASAVAASMSMGPLAGFATLMAPLMPVVIGLTAALAVGTLAWSSFAAETARGTTSVAMAQASLEESTGEAESYAAQISTVADKIQMLHDRSTSLEGDSRVLEATVRSVKSEFAAMGLDVNTVTGTVNGLIEALTGLKLKLTEDYIIKLKLQQDDMVAYQVALSGKRDIAQRAGAAKARGTLTGPAPSEFEDPNGIFGRAQATLESDANSDQLKATRRELTTLVGLLESVDEPLNSASEYALENAQLILADVETALAASEGIDVIMRSLDVNKETMATAESGKNPKYLALAAQLQSRKARMEVGVRSIQRSFKGDAIGGDTALASLGRAAELEYAGIEAGLDALVESKEITEAAADVVRQGIDGARLRYGEAKAGSAENAAPVREFEVSAKVEELATTRGEFLDLLKEATTPTQLDAAVFGLFETEAAYNLALKEQLGVLEAESSSGEIQAAQAQAKLDALTRAKESQQATVDARMAMAKGGAEVFTGGVVRAVTEFTGEYSKGMEMLTVLRQEAELRRLISIHGEKSAQVENYRLGIARQTYAESIKGSPIEKPLMDQFDANNPKRNPIEDKIKASMQLYAQTRMQSAADSEAATKMQQDLAEEARMRQLIAFFGEDSVQVANARAEAEREIFVATLETLDINETMKGVLLDMWDTTYGVTDATYGWASAMSEVGAQINGIMAALSQLGGGLVATVSKNVQIAALKAGKTAAEARQEATRDAMERESEVAQQGAQSFAERMVIKAKLLNDRFQMKQDNEIIALEAKAREKEKGSSGGGRGGGGGGRGDDAFDNFMGSMEGNLGAALANPSEAQGAQINQILETAKAEAARKAAQIAFLQGQTLSGEKQKELNRLVEEHTKLQEFVEASEKRVSGIKGVNIRQQFDLNKLVQDYVRDNLNLVNVAESGVGSVLNGWKGAFSTLFTDLSNGTKSGGDAMREFALTSAKALQSVVAEMLAVYAMKKLLGWASSAFEGDGGGFLTDMLGSLTGASAGGSVAKMAGGGRVRGNLPRDSVPALLMPEEFVMRASAVKAIGVENLERMNSEGNRRVSGSSSISGLGKSAGSRGPLNIWVAPPDQRPIPGPSDIIAVISQDMAQGGATKRLVKSIQDGRF